MSKKKIIVFEGIEGSGKSFHLNNLKKFLNKKKIKSISIREPGGSKNSEKIRRLILNNKSNFNKYADLMLYLSARCENIEKLIKPNYKKKVILIDRFIDSTLAYQGYGMNIDKNLIKKINKIIMGKLKVDFTFLHTVNNINLKKRLLKRKSLNRYDRFKMSFYKKVQNGFITISKNNKKKYMIIDSNDKISSNKSKIEKKIVKILKL